MPKKYICKNGGGDKETNISPPPKNIYTDKKNIYPLPHQNHAEYRDGYKNIINGGPKNRGINQKKKLNPKK